MRTPLIAPLIALLLLTLSGILPAQDSHKVTTRLAQATAGKASADLVNVWIYFTDKGPDLSGQIAAAAGNLTERAYRRRLRNRSASSLTDHYDVPVYRPYLRGVAAHVDHLRHQSRWLNAVSAAVPLSALQAIGELPYVRKIDLVISAHRPMPEAVEAPLPSPPPTLGTQVLDYGGSLTQDSQIHVVELHNQGFDGSGVTVAMLDAGFNNLQHEALTHLHILHTWDFVNGDSVVSDEPGQMGSGNHGTYTLSTLGGFKQGQLIGPAYNADFLLAKTENTDSERHIEEDNWVAGAEWADSLGADIISSSLGYLDFDPPEPSYTWQDMDGNTTVVTIGADIAASRGILVSNSAGNEGPASPPANSLLAPADGDSVMAVGAVNSSGIRAGFSSMGPTADGRIKPDVMAMGVATYCASPSNPAGYVTVNGTSLSCPLAAGAAALVLQANPGATNMQILEALRATADRAANPDNSYGWGILNAAAAANAVVTGIPGDPVTRPALFELFPAYPNPFNPATNIRYRLSDGAVVQLSVYNVAGQRVAILAEGFQNAGEHRFLWSAATLPSGLYFIELRAGRFRQIQKAVLMK